VREGRLQDGWAVVRNGDGKRKFRMFAKARQLSSMNIEMEHDLNGRPLYSNWIDQLRACFSVDAHCHCFGMCMKLTFAKKRTFIQIRYSAVIVPSFCTCIPASNNGPRACQQNLGSSNSLIVPHDLAYVSNERPHHGYLSGSFALWANHASHVPVLWQTPVDRDSVARLAEQTWMRDAVESSSLRQDPGESRVLRSETVQLPVVLVGCPNWILWRYSAASSFRSRVENGRRTSLCLSCI
jgi:hypothetical protein